MSVSLTLLILTLPVGAFARYKSSSGAKASYAGQEAGWGVGVIPSDESASLPSAASARASMLRTNWSIGILFLLFRVAMIWSGGDPQIGDLYSGELSTVIESTIGWRGGFLAGDEGALTNPGVLGDSL